MENIKEYRNKLDISQDRLSKLADVVYKPLLSLESGGIQSPTINTVQKIGKVLGVGLKDLTR